MSQFSFAPALPSQNGVTTRVRSEQTGNAYTVLELVLSPGVGAPLHIHQREDEIFYVVEGECTFEHDGQTYSAQAGTVVVLPKGQPHAFRNTGDTPNRLLITAVPGGLDLYFEEIGALGEDATMEQINVINQKYEIDFSPAVNPDNADQ